MDWYAARLLYECVVEADASADDEETLFQERVFVVSLDAGEDLLEKVTALAHREQLSCDNLEGNRVDWVLREILEIEDLMTDSISDSTEVYYRPWHNPDNADFEHLRESDHGQW